LWVTRGRPLLSHPEIGLEANDSATIAFLNPEGVRSGAGHDVSYLILCTQKRVKYLRKNDMF
jgi:hypothetical protein